MWIVDGTGWGSAILSTAALICCSGSALKLSKHDHDAADANADGSDVVPAQVGMQREEHASAGAESPTAEKMGSPRAAKPPPFRPMAATKVAQLVEWRSAVGSPEIKPIDSSSLNYASSALRRVNVGSGGSTPKQVRLIGEQLAIDPATQQGRRDPPPLALEASALTSRTNAATEMSMSQYE